MVKVLYVEAHSTGRDKTNLADSINEAVSGFAKAEKSEVDSIDVCAEFNTGGFGNALVTVSYNKVAKK